MSEAENYYDGRAFVGLSLGRIERGNLHRVRTRAYTQDILTRAYKGVDNSAFDDIPLEEWLDTERYEYGILGLLRAFMDARGTKVLQVGYDEYNLFPIAVTNALGQVAKAEHDYTAGQIKRYSDTNQAVTTYSFDKLGLVERVIQPGDSLPYPTFWYQYNLHIYPEQLAAGIRTPSPPYVTTWTRERPPEPGERSELRNAPAPLTAEENTHVTRTYFDALGRIIQSRSEDVNDRVLVSGWTEYNGKGKPKTQYLPFFAPGFDYMAGQRPPADTGEARIAARFYYDPLEHLAKTVNPNGTYSEVKYEPLAISHLRRRRWHADGSVLRYAERTGLRRLRSFGPRHRICESVQGTHRRPCIGTTWTTT